jgi:hypothetical protein
MSLDEIEVLWAAMYEQYGDISWGTWTRELLAGRAVPLFVSEHHWHWATAGTGGICMRESVYYPLYNDCLLGSDPSLADPDLHRLTPRGQRWLTSAMMTRGLL